jgi:serine/threonine protein kinase
VFGNELGTGAFSSVRYARQIVLDKSRSCWPEYAIKIIAADTIIEENYQIAVIREMAILQLLTHPNICRLISSFRYTSSAYLVLEYASNGDLHNLIIKKKMKLSILAIRFIICQILAGLLSIHKLGFSFNDLKPENLLITHNGYIKIADFGAARPYTTHASDILTNSKDLLASLRNGDWKDVAVQDINNNNNNNTVFNINIHGFSDDNRIEGTPAYLPPEILLLHNQATHSRNNNNKELNNNYTSTDSWALGCVTAFCLHNRPPFYGDNHEVVEQIFNSNISNSNVKFNDITVNKDNEDNNLDIKQCEYFISLLLVIDPNKRKNLIALVNDEFLSHGANDVDLVVIDTLNSHLGQSLLIPYLNNDIDNDNNSVDNQEDKQWSRRQLSKLWVPSTDDLYSSLNSNHNNDNIYFEKEYSFDIIFENEIEKYSSFI